MGQSRPNLIKEMEMPKYIPRPLSGDLEMCSTRQEIDALDALYWEKHKEYAKNIAEIYAEMDALSEKRNKIEKAWEHESECKQIARQVEELRMLEKRCFDNSYVVELPVPGLTNGAYGLLSAKTKEKPALMTFQCPPQLKRDFEGYCANQGYTVSEALRTMMRDALPRKRKEGPDPWADGR
jgi:hypothetical protein